MKLVRFISSSGPRLGVAANNGIHDLPSIAQVRGMAWAVPMLTDIRLFLLGGTHALELAARLIESSGVEPQPESAVRILAPYEASSKILAAVVNYHEHASETAAKPPEIPLFFYKPASSVVNPNDPILAHALSAKTDHEVELAVIIGRVARNVPLDRAMEYVGGYTVVNDVSYRDLQLLEGYPAIAKRWGRNWTQGKGLDHACPMGPYLVTPDSVPHPHALEVRCTVNGQVRQRSTTEKLIFKIPELIADISRSLTLYPGDVISTGTCEGSGVGTGMWLRPGDLVECYVERVGTLRNPVVAPNLGGHEE